MVRQRASHNASKKAVEVVYVLVVDISFGLARGGKTNIYISEIIYTAIDIVCNPAVCTLLGVGRRRRREAGNISFD